MSRGVLHRRKKIITNKYLGGIQVDNPIITHKLINLGRSKHGGWINYLKEMANKFGLPK